MKLDKEALTCRCHQRTRTVRLRGGWGRSAGTSHPLCGPPAQTQGSRTSHPGQYKHTSFHLRFPCSGRDVLCGPPVQAQDG
eukprot:1158598-Pelagomonas_calceolata.AAC.7